jgi:hypothetical protein
LQGCNLTIQFGLKFDLRFDLRWIVAVPDPDSDTDPTHQETRPQGGWD